MDLTTVLIVLNILLSGVLILLLLKNKPDNILKNFTQNLENQEKNIRDEFIQNRREFSENFKSTRDEIRSSIKDFGGTVLDNLKEISNMQRENLSSVGKELKQLTESNEEKLDNMKTSIENKMKSLQDESSKNNKENRQELNDSLQKFETNISQQMDKAINTQKEQLSEFAQKLVSLTEKTELQLEKMRESIQNSISNFKNESFQNNKSHREELSKSMTDFGGSISEQMDRIGKMLENTLTKFGGEIKALTERTEQKLEGVRTTVESKLKDIQEDNNKKMKEMQQIVDEKLHDTLEKRLGESFKIVNDNLESVYKGLGEMQELANGVGDLKKVLTNVKSRGTWGEIQLDRIIEDILTPEQYSRNVKVKPNSNDIVEFAVKLPGRDDSAEVYMPIDAKFPSADYERLADAQEIGDTAKIIEYSKKIEDKIIMDAKTIRSKYIEPPFTTDFAILFLPTEGLYAEVIRRPGLAERLQREFRVILTGPTTLAALLNSLQMGFKTLAIEKRSSEVWRILSAVKSEFGKFGDMLEKTQKKLQETSNVIESVMRRKRVMVRKLRGVSEISDSEVTALLGDDDEGDVLDSE